MTSITDEQIEQAAGRVAARGGGSAAIARQAAELVLSAAGRYDADLQQSIFERIEARLTTLPAAAPAPKPRRTPMAQRAQEVGDWPSADAFFSGVMAAAVKPTLDPRLLLAANPTGLGRQIPSDGGFLVAPQFSSAIWDAVNARATSLAALCDQYTVTGDTLTLNANAETSRVDGSLYGGLRSYWISEADAITESKPKFRQIKLEPQQLVALVYCTDRMIANGGAGIGEFLTAAAARVIDAKLSAAIIAGTGAGQPLGLMNSSALVTVSKEGGQAAATITSDNTAKMCARLLPECWPTAVWLAHPSTAPQIWKLTGQFDPATETLLGRRIIWSDRMQTLGTVGDLSLWDPQSYALGLGAAKNDLSMHVRFIYAETAFRFTVAVDGQPWLASAVTPAVGSDTLSSFVTLATRS
jgi:HK97 family phage major capsid protein